MELNEQVTKLKSMPEWKFCVVFAEGFYSDPCAGTMFEGDYYSERAIYFAYLERNPGADPLI